MKTKPRLNFWQIWNMTFGFLGIQFGFALQNANSSRILQTYGADVDKLSLFWLAAPLTGMIIQPIIGHYSDRTWCKLGRRRPYFLVGAILTTVALFLMPNAGLLMPAETVHAILSPVLIGAGMLMIMDASINVTMEPFRALVADVLPEEQRTLGFSVQTFLIGVGAVVGSALPYILSNWFGFSSEVDGNEISQNVKWSFYIGGGILLTSVLWTIIRTKEYSPQEYAEFEDTKKAEPAQFDKGILQIWDDIKNMPSVMKQLGICQFFSWFALFSLWVYTVPAVAEHVYNTTDALSPEYQKAGDEVGTLFSAYNFIAMLVALSLPYFAKKSSRKITHALALIIGGIGLISMFFFKTTDAMYFSMICIGIAWASILAMPYAILSNALPQEKMGIYMGIFNFFITFPQIVNGLFHGWIVNHVYGRHPIYALLTGGIFFLLAAVSVMFVKDNEKQKLVTD